MPETMSPDEQAAYDAAEADDEPGDERHGELAAEDERQESEPEPAPEPPPDAPPPDVPPPEQTDVRAFTPEQFEGRAKKVGQAFARYEKAVTNQLDMLEDDLTRCPLCPELHPGFVNVGDAGRLPDEVAQVVRLFLGETLPADYRDAAETKACDACNGLGKVRSGSRVANYELLTCPRCTGTGYYPPPTAYAAPAQGVVTNGNGDVVETFTAERTDADPWGSPRLLDNGTENPNYGRMPQFKDGTLP